MPYHLKKSGSGYKVTSAKHPSGFSKKPLSKGRAKKQMAAIYANTNEGKMSLSDKMNARLKLEGLSADEGYYEQDKIDRGPHPLVVQAVYSQGAWHGTAGPVNHRGGMEEVQFQSEPCQNQRQALAAAREEIDNFYSASGYQKPSISTIKYYVEDDDVVACEACSATGYVEHTTSGQGPFIERVPCDACGKRGVVPANNVVTKYEPKPIPNRNFDWTAHGDDYDGPGSPIGYGATEEEAVANYRQQLDQ